MPSIIINNNKLNRVNIQLNDSLIKNQFEIKNVAKHPILGFILKWFNISSKVKFFSTNDEEKFVYINTNSLASHLLEKAGFAYSKKDVKAFKARLKQENINLKKIDSEKLLQIWQKALTGPLTTCTVQVHGISNVRDEKIAIVIDSNDTPITLARKAAEKYDEIHKDYPVFTLGYHGCSCNDVLQDGKSLITSETSHKKLIDQLKIRPESNLSVHIIIAK